MFHLSSISVLDSGKDLNWGLVQTIDSSLIIVKNIVSIVGVLY
jgi:hypothetical protein